MEHRIYSATVISPEDDLQQGDIIRRTPELRAVLDEAHKHFLNEKYSAFIVLTQSCDLARRGGNPCKSRYINLAVVRPLEDILLLLLDATGFHKFTDGIYIKEDRSRAEQLVSRIINQNEQGQGLFYLHPDADAGIAVPSVALLQVSIALKCQHYEVLRNARMGRLTKEFQSRLGWLAGNLYSRVATEDWPKDLSRKIIENVLTPTDNIAGPYWVPRDSVREAGKQKIVTEGKDASEIVETLKGLKTTHPIDVAIERTIHIVKDVIHDTTPQDLEKIRDLLITDQRYEEAFRRH